MPIATIAEINAITGIPERTIRDWRKKGIIPGGATIAAAVMAIVAHFKVQAERRSEEGDDELYQEKVRLTRAQADEKELKVAEQEGRLLDAELVRREMGSLVAAFRAKTLSLPVKIAPQLNGLSPAEAEALIKDFLYEALSELARYQPSDPE
ncbi:MAG: hypothetical protein HC934_03010 [Acaryochloridaceae cyanobacterium SU_2_1]|nr:hypothetical protein [Acaryochloridaceae cyanobacterium SU_2_1]